MADLAGRDRGQLILVAAFALAVTFVALALVVNSAIFTENLASRGETGGSTDALTLRQDVERGVGSSIESANIYNTSSQSNLEAGVTTGIGNVNRAFSRQHAAETAIVNVSEPTSFDHGSRIAQNESGGRLFTDASGNADWNVVDDVDRSASDGNATRAFVMNVTTASLETTPSDRFKIVVEKWQDSTTTWTMELWQTDSPDTVHARVAVDGLGTDATCSQEVSGEFVHVDVTGGTIAGAPCDALRRNDTDGDGSFENYRFASGVGDRYNITFENGGQARGNYSFVTNNQSMGSSSTLNTGVGSSSPYWDHAIYSVDVEFVYESPQLDYETTVRVAPGEPE